MAAAPSSTSAIEFNSDQYERELEKSLSDLGVKQVDGVLACYNEVRTGAAVRSETGASSRPIENADDAPAPRAKSTASWFPIVAIVTARPNVD